MYLAARGLAVVGRVSLVVDNILFHHGNVVDEHWLEYLIKEIRPDRECGELIMVG